MTQLRLTEDYINSILHGGLLKGKRFHDKFDFFTHVPPARTSGESYKPADVANDPTNVPIFKGGEIVRFAGSVADPIESYGFNRGDIIEMPAELAERWLARMQVVNGTEINFFDEII